MRNLVAPHRCIHRPLKTFSKTASDRAVQFNAQAPASRLGTRRQDLPFGPLSDNPWREHMPVDFTAGPEGGSGDPTTSESAMFAPVPSWERNKKRRGKA